MRSGKSTMFLSTRHVRRKKIKIPAFKERARNHENMRKRFETSLKEAGLELDSPDPQETSRDLVSRF